MLRILTPQTHQFNASRWRGRRQTWGFGLKHDGEQGLPHELRLIRPVDFQKLHGIRLLLPLQSRSHPGDPRVALILPRRVDVATRLRRVSRTSTYARSRTRTACLLFVLQTGRQKSLSVYPEKWRDIIQAATSSLCAAENSPGRGYSPAGCWDSLQTTTDFLARTLRNIVSSA